MDTFKAYILKKAYERYQKIGDKLAKIEHLIDWEAFRPIIQPLYHNKGPRGARVWKYFIKRYNSDEKDDQ